MKRKLKHTIIGILLIMGGVFFILSYQIGGFRAFIVSSSSMEPAIPTGSLLITQYASPHTLQRGDTITFLPPTKEKEFVTHRIIKAYHQKDLSTFVTKGDNNNNEDPWKLAGGAIVGKVMVTIPYLGYLFSFTQSKLGIFFFILLPAVYIIIDELYSVMKTVREHRATKKASISEA